jgi:hypothetical protein
MRIISALLIAAFIAQGGFARTLEKNEVWTDCILLEEDVIVPSGRSLTISAGTLVFTNGHKILSYGKVAIQGEEENQVRFIPLTEIGSSEIEVIKVRPYNINTRVLKKEFQAFRTQYAILWSLLFASIFLTLEASR